MANIDLTKFFSVFVVTLFIVGCAAPLLANITMKSEEVTTENTYGTNALGSYVDTIASSEYGSVTNAYEILRGDFNTTTGFTENSLGDYLKVPFLALTFTTFHYGTDQYMYMPPEVGSGWATFPLPEGEVYLTRNNYEIVLAPNSQNNEIADVSATGSGSDERAYCILPYDVKYDAPTQTVYADNTIQTSTVSSVVGTMSGTTFTTDPNGDYLSIPLYVLNNGTNTYKVAGGATYYAPDSTGSLAAFTAPNTSGINSAITIAFTQDSTITSDTVYIMTASSSDQDLPPVIIPKSVTSTTTAPISNATYAVTNTDHSFYIDSNHDLYATGHNASGQLGLGDTTDRSSWTKSASNVETVIVSPSSSYYISTTGVLYVTGDNVNGMLGLGDDSTRTSWVQSATDVVQLAAGNNFAHYIDTDGDLYAAGNGEFAGDGYTSNHTSWTKTASDVKSISVYGYNIFYITNDGDLYGVGQNIKGQIGNGNTQQILRWSLVAQDVSQVYTVRDWNAGYTQSFYISTSGDLYATGSNASGQLGLGDTTDRSSWTLTASGVSKVYAAPAHTAYISTSGALYTAGFGNSYRLGTGNTTDQTSWVQVATSAAEVYGGSASTLYIDQSTLFAVGDNYNKELGINTSTVQNWTQSATGVSQYTTGRTSYNSSYGALYVSDTGGLYGTGANNYGNLGTGDTTKKNSWIALNVSSEAIVFTNQIETVDVSDIRGTITNNVFAPSVSGDMLQIPLRNAGQYTYYIGDGATYYAPNASDALIAFTAPDFTGINSAISLTFTDMGATYYNTLNSMVASVTDTDLKALVIPFTATYTDNVSTHYGYNSYGASSALTFVPDESGSLLKIPSEMNHDNGFDYVIDVGQSYYMSWPNGWLYPSMGLVTGTTTYVSNDAISIEFINDGIEPSTTTVEVHIDTGSEGSYIVIPKEYYQGGVNAASTYSITYESVRGNMTGGVFVADANGTWVSIPGPVLDDGNTYHIADGATYYSAQGYGGEPDEDTAEAGTDADNVTMVTNSSVLQVLDITGDDVSTDYTIILPYNVTYYTTSTETIELIPLAGLLVTVLIVVAIVSVIGLVYNRGGRL